MIIIIMIIVIIFIIMIINIIIIITTINVLITIIVIITIIIITILIIISIIIISITSVIITNSSSWYYAEALLGHSPSVRFLRFVAEAGEIPVKTNINITDLLHLCLGFSCLF